MGTLSSEFVAIETKVAPEGEVWGGGVKSTVEASRLKGKSSGLAVTRSVPAAKDVVERVKKALVVLLAQPRPPVAPGGEEGTLVFVDCVQGFVPADAAGPGLVGGRYTLLHRVKQEVSIEAAVGQVTEAQDVAL